MTPDRWIKLLAWSTLSATLTGCMTTAPAPQAGATAHPERPEVRQQPPLNFKLTSGEYHCELGQKIEIERDAHNGNLIAVNWQGHRRTLRRYDSTSGLPRYEDRASGLLWIDLPWKSILMDLHSGRPLANECKASRS